MAPTGKGRGLVADKRYDGRARSPKPAPKPRKTPPRRPPRKRGLFSRLVLWVWGLIWTILWRIGLLFGLVLGCAVLYFYVQLPDVDDLIDGRARGSVTMLDASDKVFAWRGETFGGQVTPDTVSPSLLHAVLATEDKRFYYHLGVSPRGILSAIVINLEAGRGAFEGNGGSTITQQTAKLLCLGVRYDPRQWKSEAEYEDDCRSGGLMRKIKEVPYAIAMEVKYTKDEILTIYFNRAYLGAGSRGFQAASQRYFGKEASEVSPAEAAMLAGLLKAPSRYAPTANLKRAQDRAAVIIGLMRDQGYLSVAEAEEAIANPAVLSEAAARNAGGAFADWVMEATPDYLGSDTTEDVVIRTTLDQRVQRAAEEGLKAVFSTKLRAGSKTQAAIVVMSADGAVRAMVGGRDLPQAGSFNRATQALRQTGSSFKPFVYASALDKGWSPYDFVDDSPLTITIKGSGAWTPSNYDEEFKGVIPIVKAMQESRNIPAVKIAMAVGLDRVREVAAGFGVRQELAKGPALALGASEATLLEMTGAYAGILNGGVSVLPFGMRDLRLKGDEDPLMGASGGVGERVISPEANGQLVWMMTQVIQGGTGGRAALGDRPVAGKTGTTSEARDAWFIGFTGDYVAGVWMGYDDNTPLKGVTGGGLPAEIWHEVMTRVEEGQPVTPLPMIVPDVKLPPLPDTPETPLPPPADQAPAAQDPISSIIEDLLGGND